MASDGEIDFSSYSRAALEESRQRIDATKYPLNYSRLLAEIERRKGVETSNAQCDPPSATNRHRIEFRADPKEYFRIWIINLALTVVTIGIYSPWAKVRKLNYFYSNTTLAGSSFGYHGDPIKILKGRLIAAAIAGAYFVATQTSPIATLCFAVVVAIATPWLVVKSRIFTMRVTSWRGIRFDFCADYRGAYRVLLGWLVASIVSIGILFPRFLRERYRFIVNTTRFGTAEFTCAPAIGRFYWTALGTIGLSIVISIGVGIAVALVAKSVLQIVGAAVGNNILAVKIMSLLMTLAVYVVLVPVLLGYPQARNLNEVINNTKIGPHRLYSSLSARKLIAIYFTNVLWMIATLGLYTPWAQVRLAQYRLGAIEIEPQGSLDEITSSGPTSVPTATSEEISSLLDVDFGF